MNARIWKLAAYAWPIYGETYNTAKADRLCQFHLLDGTGLHFRDIWLFISDDGRFFLTDENSLFVAINGEEARMILERKGKTDLVEKFFAIEDD